MKNVKWVLISILTCLLFILSCDDDSNILVPDTEDTSYNFAYEDSILLTLLESCTLQTFRSAQSMEQVSDNFVTA